jgi:hypothetical protein
MIWRTRGAVVVGQGKPSRGEGRPDGTTWERRVLATEGPGD